MLFIRFCWLANWSPPFQCCCCCCWSSKLSDMNWSRAALGDWLRKMSIDSLFFLSSGLSSAAWASGVDSAPAPAPAPAPAGALSPAGESLEALSAAWGTSFGGVSAEALSLVRIAFLYDIIYMSYYNNSKEKKKKLVVGGITCSPRGIDVRERKMLAKRGR